MIRVQFTLQASVPDDTSAESLGKALRIMVEAFDGSVEKLQAQFPHPNVINLGERRALPQTPPSAA